MNTVISESKLNHSQKQSKARANELMQVFNQYADQIQVLSLDCFDTLLWRKTDAPRDVFYNLEKKPLFKDLSFSALMRVEGEQRAYQLNRVKYGYHQTTISEIYRVMFPELNDDQIAHLVETEINEEIETCYPFPPVVELIRAAAAKKIKIIIVSDIYFEQHQLRQLLENKLPPDIMAVIDEVNCSCDYKKSKAEGLFNDVVKKLKINPNSILHIGDNPIADFDAPKLLGIHAVHFLQYSNSMQELMRMQAIAASYIDPTIRTLRALLNPFKSVIANHMTHDFPEQTLGYATLGPIMYAFARFVLDEIKQLQSNGKKPKVIFLMRDAYLPALACEQLAGNKIGYQVRISRFTALAASFRNKNDVENYLAINAKSGRFEDMCHQLQIPKDIADVLIQKSMQDKQPVLLFSQMVLHEKILQLIFAQSALCRARLFNYLINEIGLQINDTLLFVDLGYSCTTQNKLEPILREELNIDVHGCYLLALRAHGWSSTRKGLLDPTHYDDNALVMLVTYISLLEQLCTSEETSSVNFDDNGNVIYSDVAVNEEQHSKRIQVQNEALRFVKDAAELNFDMKTLSDVAAINLCRLIYFPIKNELEFLKSFASEVSLGTKEIIPLFDTEKGVTNLRRRGWLNAAKENGANMRMIYPAEWRAANLELSMTLMAQHRFGFQFSLNELSHRHENILITYEVNNDASKQITVNALQTHDGYFSLCIPVVKGMKAGVHFGLRYRWLEIESAEIIKLTSLYSQYESQNSMDASNCLAVNKMVDKGGGLFECEGEESLLMFFMPENIDNENYVLRIVFRPIVKV